MGKFPSATAQNPDFTGKTLIADKITLLANANDTIQIPNGAAMQDSNGAGANFRIFFDHNGIRPTNVTGVIHSVAGNEAAGATAGGGAAPPATVQGYLVTQDSAGNARKVPYYAN